MRHSWYSSVGRETTQIDVVLEKRLKDLQRFVATETITNKYMQFSHCSVLNLLVKNRSCHSRLILECRCSRFLLAPPMRSPAPALARQSYVEG
jgi:hypothetical protein